MRVAVAIYNILGARIVIIIVYLCYSTYYYNTFSYMKYMYRRRKMLKVGGAQYPIVHEVCAKLLRPCSFFTIEVAIMSFSVKK